MGKRKIKRPNNDFSKDIKQMKKEFHEIIDKLSDDEFMALLFSLDFAFDKMVEDDLIDEEDLEYYDEDDDLFEDLEDLEDLEYYEEEDDDDDDDDEKPDNIINLFKDDDLPF